MQPNYDFICLVGIDGAGKTFYVHKLQELFSKSGFPVIHIWTRFNNYLSRPLLLFTRMIKLNYKVHENGVKIGYHDFYKSKIISIVFIAFQILDNFIDILVKYKMRSPNTLILGDRSAYDTIVDILVDTHCDFLLNQSFIKLFTFALPTKKKVIYISRPKSMIFSSRPDVRVDKNFDVRLSYYQKLQRHLNLTEVRNDAAPDQVLNQILDHINR